MPILIIGYRKMQFLEFIEKTNLDEKIACGMLDREQIYQLYMDTIQPCYMVSNFDTASKFCKFYRRFGFIKAIDKCKNDFMHNVYITSLDKNYMGNYTVKLYNPCLNTEYSHVYCGYTKKEILGMAKTEFYWKCLNMFK